VGKIGSVGEKGVEEGEGEMKRPQPPRQVIDSIEPLYLPAPDLESWTRQTFIEGNSPLLNDEHRHLQAAHIGFIWTNEENTRHMHRLAGQAELVQPKGGAWQKGMVEQQLRDMFGAVPDFKIVIDAHYAQVADDASFCALIEHELLHCGQRYKDGSPMFRKDGKPVFGLRGHDVEEFVSIVRRYGVGAAAGETRALVEAARMVPAISASKIAGVCGTCKLRAV
jgi:hypothetical protein